MSRIPLTALVLAATALVAFGCGGSSKTGSSATSASKAEEATTPPAPTSGPIRLASGKPLTRADWIAKGDAICERAKIRTSTVKTTATTATHTIPQIVAYERIEARELSQLVPPASMARDWAQIVNGLARDSDYLDTVARDIARKAARAATASYHRAAALYGQLLEVARRDGFVECAHLQAVRHSRHS